jgi:ribose/xylose/arabinose/galactoside ABC-type transport system permease subunit
LGLVTIGLHVPAWAVSLAGAIGLGAWTVARSESSGAAIGYDPSTDAYLWFGVVAALSVVVSLLLLHPGLRRGLGRFRPVADPARRRGTVAVIIAVGATVASTVLGGFAGVVATLHEGPVNGDLQVAFLFTALGLGVALLGGTSIYGRRGGVFGTVLAAALVTVMVEWLDELRQDWPVEYVVFAALLLGLVATRLVERFGRPVLRPPAEEEESWMPRAHPPAPPPASWGPTPAGGLWSSDDVWGGPPR